MYKDGFLYFGAPQQLEEKKRKRKETGGEEEMYERTWKEKDSSGEFSI